MLIEQIIEFEWRGLGPYGRTCTPIPTVLIFMTKRKPLRKIFEWIIIYC